MITPSFACSQTAESVVVSIYCPSIRVSDTDCKHAKPMTTVSGQASEVEIHVDETFMTVHINPYFLRLNFSNRLLEDDESSANYDPGSGYLTVTLTKEKKGEYFKDLDLLAKLLSPRPKGAHQPTIEVVGSEDISNDDENYLVEKTQGLSLGQKEIARGVH
jgi:protein SHQ1